MAHSRELWDKAKGYYEAGLSLAQIKDKTGIDRSAISKKAKNQQWQQGENTDYIEAKELIAVKKSTKNQQSLMCADEIADENIRRKNLVYGLAEKILSNIDKSVSQKIKDEEGKETEEEILLDSKSAKEYIEAVDKASITLGVSQRHANSQVVVNNQNNMQQNTNLELTEEDAMKKALELGVPLSALTSP